MDAPDSDKRRGASTRRRFLLGGAVAGVGAAAAIGLDYGINRAAESTPSAAPPRNGDEVVPFHGTHQAGIDTDAQAHATFVGLDLNADTDADALRRLMRILTDDAARLTQGEQALADSEPELAMAPARLTVTFGFGPGLVALAGGDRPTWLASLPAFETDRLQPEFSDGDLLIQIAADDPITVAHATRMLLKDSRSFAKVRWTQHGFRRAHGTVAPGTTMRNLFGQVDGTTNLAPGTEDFDRLVWSASGWLAGGTGAVIRRIHMDLDKWDRLDRGGREQSVGRFLHNGAPLTGENEHDEADFTATTAIGFPVIPEFSHMRRARSDNPDERFFRRGYNYDQPPTGEQVSDSGLIFVSFQADVDRQFVPIQRRLDELDLLNEWIAPIGSAVFAIPPGCERNGYIGETLLG
ncbi:Dyp-type peroxidase [Actinoalloteichus hymeniacidonis]|uniref:Dyp-type peroxidase family n=1 Tax=Actinoalloteichus hymeniacidonis TaxID=340345 RepID=A0AAC9HMX3_9PSEU|nr:Dyp-type peroxidase [Actinoalloteichus hymeniacidonis]AOS62079.1 Dyp-type peroxidase family [Actinoalloteichus hymeniacidonis]MBB5909899.1 dye decolorizing peroxidase [Actinoalloteichus hymeniacidonis]